MVFHPKEIDRLNAYISKLFERGKSVKVEPITTSKTLSQVGYAWLCFTVIGEETGNTKDDIYQFCLKKFPVFKSIEINGLIQLVPKTMSGFDKEEMSHFTEEFTVYFRSEGISIPDPDDKLALDQFNFYKERGII